MYNGCNEDRDGNVDANENKYYDCFPIEFSQDLTKYILNDDLDNFLLLASKIPNWDKLKFCQSGEFIFHKCIRMRANKIIKFLIEKRVNFNLKESEGKTVLHLGLEEGLCDVNQYILRNNPSEIEFSCDDFGDNELHKWIVYHSSCEDCLSSLGKFSLIKKEYFTNKNFKGNNGIHQCILDENLYPLKLLASGKYFKFNLNEEGENGNSLLHLACYFKNTKIFDFIYSLNIFDIDSKNSKLQSPLTISLLNENFYISEILLGFGAKITTSDKRIAYEKSNKTLYSKLKNLYENQQKSKLDSRVTANISRSSTSTTSCNKNLDLKNIPSNNEENKFKILSSNDETKDLKNHRNSSMKKVSNQKEKVFLFEEKIQICHRKKLSIDNNMLVMLEDEKKHVNINTKSPKDVKNSVAIIKSPIFNKNEISYKPEEVEPRFKNSTPVLNNTKNLTSKILSNSSISDPQKTYPLKMLSQNFLNNEKEAASFQSIESNDSISISSSDIVNNITNKNVNSKLLKSNTFSSNLFTKNTQYQQIQNSKDAPFGDNNKNSFNYVPQQISLQKNDHSHSTNNRRPYSTLIGNNFHLDSLINFEYIKNFTSLEYKDIKKEELIYSADICKVFKGKYLFLPVAIKVYNISKLQEEDLVRKLIFYFF